jgi:predicted  nucleic acid-binding Zn-ribbon protein
MDLRYGNAAADGDQADAEQREYRCLNCGETYLTAGDPCPDCGARHRRYIGPLPGDPDHEDETAELADRSSDRTRSTGGEHS